MDDDLALLAAWRDGDQAAGQRLVKRHFASVCRLFRSKLGDDVNDIIQRTFLDSIESLDRIDPAIGFLPYLLGIARNRLYDELSRRHRDPGFDPATHSLKNPQTSPTGKLALRQEVVLLSRALRSLPMDQQITLELFYWEQMRGKQIGVAMGVSENTVRSRLARAKEALRSEITALAESAELCTSTLNGIDAWVRQVGDSVGAD